MTSGSATFLPNPAFCWKSSPGDAAASCQQGHSKSSFNTKRWSSGTSAMSASGYLWSRLKTGSQYSLFPTMIFISPFRGCEKFVGASAQPVLIPQPCPRTSETCLFQFSLAASPASDSVPISILFPLLFLLLQNFGQQQQLLLMSCGCFSQSYYWRCLRNNSAAL